MLISIFSKLYTNVFKNEGEQVEERMQAETDQLSTASPFEIPAALWG